METSIQGVTVPARFFMIYDFNDYVDEYNNPIPPEWEPVAVCEHCSNIRNLDGATGVKSITLTEYLSSLEEFGKDRLDRCEFFTSDCQEAWQFKRAPVAQRPPTNGVVK